MKKYKKILMACMLTLSMVITCISSESVNAKTDIAKGDDVYITYYGANLLSDRYGIYPVSTYWKNINTVNKRIAISDNSNLMINPTANVDWDSVFNYLKEVFYDSQGTDFEEDAYYTDDYDNVYYGYYTEQVYKNVTYELVGWKLIGKSTTAPADKSSVDEYLKKYSFSKRSDAEKEITFMHNQLINYSDWTAAIAEREKEYGANAGYADEMNLVAIYTTEKESNFGKGEYTYDGNSKWSEPRKQIEETTSEIETKVDFDKKEIIFTIPENFDGENIQLTLNDELVELFAFRLLSNGAEIIDGLNKPGWNKENPYVNVEPGDVMNFEIKIINNSKYDYGYKGDSLEITTPDLNSYYEAGYTSPTSTEMYGFDGQRLMQKFMLTRIPNEALRALAGDDVHTVLKSDAELGKLLDALYGSSGIDNLNKYYIDYYNAKYASVDENYVNKKRIDEFDVETIKDMFYNPLQSFMDTPETNKEVGETMYNYFYNAVLGVAPAKYLPKPGTQEAGASYLNPEYTLGNFMRKGNATFEDYMNSQLDVVYSNKNDKSVTWGYQIDGPKCFNIYNFMDYGFDFGFKLEKKIGKVTVNKTIEVNEGERNENPTFIFKLTDSKGVEHFKALSFEEGELEKSVTFENLPYGSYTVEEIDSIRYEVKDGTTRKGEINDSNSETAHVDFTNTKVKDNDFSDSSLVVNSFKKTVSADGKTVIKPVKTEHNNKVRG